MNFYYENQLQSLTKHTLTTVCLHSLVQVINKPTHKCGHIVRPDDGVKKHLLLKTHLNQIIIALNSTSTFQSLSHLPYTRLLGTWQTLTVHHLLLNLWRIMAMWLECRFLDTEVDGSNLGIRMLCP